MEVEADLKKRLGFLWDPNADPSAEIPARSFYQVSKDGLDEMHVRARAHDMCLSLRMLAG